MPKFRILHVSDLHIAERARQISWPKNWRRPQQLLAGLWGGGGRLARFASHDYGVLSCLIDYVNRHAGHIDAVLLTGDIATTGGARDQQTAHTLVVGRHPSFASAQVPLWIMPGNHDRFGTTRAPAISTAFDAHFGGHWSCGQGAELLGVLQCEDANLAVIGADFTFRTTQPTAGDFFGGGEVSQTVLSALEALTDRVRERDERAIIVWACHFAPSMHDAMPKEIASAPRYLQLENGGDLVRSATNHGVHALLVGHLHNNSSYVAVGGTRVSIAGSASQYLTRFGHWVHLVEVEVRATGIATRVFDVRWDPVRLRWGPTDYSRVL